MYYSRQLEKAAKALSKEYPVLMVTGPRQVGKTTMLQNIGEENRRAYVTLDDMDARILAKSDPKLFLQAYKPPVLIDEIQYAPELLPYIKIHADQSKKPGEIWLTGSQKHQMIKGASESLAGRVAIIDMQGFSLAEINKTPSNGFSCELDELLDRENSGQYPMIDVQSAYEMMWRGSLPKVIAGEVTDIASYYSNYVKTYIERDIRDLAGIKDTLALNRFLSSCAARCSTMLSYAELARDAEISQPTAKAWLNVLVSMGIIFLLQPYFNNQLKRITKTPKLYFNDTGLVSWLCRWLSPITLEKGAMNGQLMENFAVSEIIKSYSNNLRHASFWYYRDKEQHEIDLIIEEDGKLHPIEVKKSASPSKDAISNFSVLDKANLPVGNGGVVCLAQKAMPLDERNTVIPLGLI